MNAASAFLPVSPPHSPSLTKGVKFFVYSLSDLPSVLPENELVLRYMMQGELRCRLHQYHFSLQEGDYLLANPGQSILLLGNNHNSGKVLQVQIPLEAIENLVEADEVFGWEKEVFWDRKEQISFCEGSYKAEEDRLGHTLIRLATQMGQPVHASIQSQEGETIVRELLQSQSQIFDQINRLTSAKLSTKKELYRRLLQAQEFIHENLHTNLDLDTLSQVACLSKFHFIRLFKEVFEVTPRQYLITCRLDRASKMLVNTSKSFHDICLEVGLKDSSSFGRLFKKNYGATPHIYRRQYAQVG